MQAFRFQSLLRRGFVSVSVSRLCFHRSFCQTVDEHQSSSISTAVGEASDGNSRCEVLRRPSMAAVPFASLITGGILRAFPRPRREKDTRGRGADELDENIRKQGLVPALLIDQEKVDRKKRDMLLSLEQSDVVRLVKELGKRDFLSRTFDLNIFSSSSSNDIQESVKVLPRNLNYGDGKTNILNIQLLRVPPNGMLRLGVRLEYLGQQSCPGIKKGGTLIKHAKYVMYHCTPYQLPAKMVVDLSVLEIGDRVLVKHLEIDKDLLDMDECTLVCEITKETKSTPTKRRGRTFVKYMERPDTKPLSDEGDKNPVPAKKMSKTKIHMGSRLHGFTRASSRKQASFEANKLEYDNL